MRPPVDACPIMAQLTIPLRFASGASDDPDTAAALFDVCAQIESHLSGSVDLLLAFASSHHAGAFETITDHLGEAFDPDVSLGTMARGVIGSRREFQDGPGLSVLAATIPDAVLTPFEFSYVDWSAMADKPDQLRRAVGATETPPQTVMLLADPFSTPVMRMLPAFDAALPGVPIIGGTASGAAAAGENRLAINGRLRTQGVVGLAISGDITVDCGVSQGCRPIGEPHVITRSKRHVVLQLGGHRATDVLKQTVKDLNSQERELVRAEGVLVGRVIDEYKSRFGRGDFLIRKLDGHDEDHGYVAVHDTQVRTGQTIQFHIRDKHTAVEDLAMLLEAQKVYGQAAGAVLFSCTGRGLNLFDRPNTDVTMIRKALGDVPLAGFFAAGQIGPVGGCSFLHSHAASLMVFRPGR